MSRVVPLWTALPPGNGFAPPSDGSLVVPFINSVAHSPDQAGHRNKKIYLRHLRITLLRKMCDRTWGKSYFVAICRDRTRGRLSTALKSRPFRGGPSRPPPRLFRDMQDALPTLRSAPIETRGRQSRHTLPTRAVRGGHEVIECLISSKRPQSSPWNSPTGR